jgi:hypothetical protein
VVSPYTALYPCLYGGVLFALFFDLGGGGNMFLRNVGRFSKEYTTLYFRRQNFVATAVGTSNPTNLSIQFTGMQFPCSFSFKAKRIHL